MWLIYFYLVMVKQGVTDSEATLHFYFCKYLLYFLIKHCYRNVPKFSDRQVWANSADPDQTAPISLISRLLPLDVLLYGKATLFKF